MTTVEATIVASIISGVIGGSLAVVAAILVVNRGFKYLVPTEINRHRVNCITNLYGLRHVVTKGNVALSEDKARFMFEMNRAGALFADDSEILKELRDFSKSVDDRSKDATTKLIHLFKNMGAKTWLQLNNLNNEDVLKIFRIT